MFLKINNTFLYFRKIGENLYRRLRKEGGGSRDGDFVLGVNVV